MKKEIIKSEVIELNKQFGGALINESALEFTVEMANRQENIYLSNAHVTRGIILNHPFLDGNKRTAATIIVRRFADEEIVCNEEKLVRCVVSIAKNNIHSIIKIVQKLRKCCKKIK